MSKFHTDVNDIPSEITNGYIPGTEAKDYKDFKKIARRSKFKVLINPNVSYKGLDQNGRNMLAGKLITAKNSLTTAFEAGQLIIDRGQGIPKLINVEGTPEIGQKSGFIHIMVIYSFDEYCWLDLPAISKAVRGLMTPLSPRVSVQYLRDNGEIASAYVNKSADAPAPVPDNASGDFPAFTVQHSGVDY